MKPRRTWAALMPQTPFGNLVAHFVNRLFAGDDVESEEGMSLTLGAVLGVLAIPGAFSSILLLDKYSPLLQWLRGHRINPYRASISDEYFFIVLSMTITGLVMVLRWNRLLPDRRDYANLAVLPIPIRSVFIANFTALLGLGLLIGADVNAASSFLFPAVVTIGEGTLSAFLHIALSHAAAVLSASLFSFFAVFALVGVLMFTLPKRLFQSVSLAVRILLVAGLLTEFCSNIFLHWMTSQTSGRPSAHARLLPSFWFLGVYEHFAGLADTEMNRLAQLGMLVLVVTVAVSMASYLLCYRRHFLHLAESLDTIRAPAPVFRVRLSEMVTKWLFRSGFEQGCAGFMTKALFRSERHLLFFGAYMGVAIVLIMQTAMDAAARGGAESLPNADQLAIPLMIVFFLVTGLRFVFERPAILKANWVFRSIIETPQPSPNFVVRKFLFILMLGWELILMAPFLAHRYGWFAATGETLAVIAFTVLLIELAAANFHRIPFTCSSAKDVRQVVVRILVLVFSVLAGLPILAQLEHWILLEPVRTYICGFLLVVATLLWFRYRRSYLPENAAPEFDETHPAAFELLKLS